MAVRKTQKQRLKYVIDPRPTPPDELILMEDLSTLPADEFDRFLRMAIPSGLHRNRLTAWLLEGRTYPEIARDEQVSYQAVEHSVSKGLSVLREMGVDDQLIAEIRLKALEERTDMGRVKLLGATRGLGLTMRERQEIVAGILERRERR